MFRSIVGPCAFILLLLLPGCTTQPAEAPTSERGGWSIPTGQEILDAYAPRNVTLFRLSLNDTVVEPLGPEVHPVSYHESGWFEFDEANRTAIIQDLSGAWLFQDGDLVVLADYKLSSDRHDVDFQSIALINGTRSIMIHLGGFNVRFFAPQESVALAWVGPFTEGTYACCQLANWADEPWPSGEVFEHEGVLPVIREDEDSRLGRKPDYVHRTIISNFTMTYWGQTQLKVRDDYIIDARGDPSILDEGIRGDISHFTPGMRYGQLVPSCDAFLMKSYDPCMTLFAWPSF